MQHHTDLVETGNLVSRTDNDESNQEKKMNQKTHLNKFLIDRRRQDNTFR